MFDNCTIKTTPCDAESSEEQDGGKQYFIQGGGTHICSALQSTSAVKLKVKGQL